MRIQITGFHHAQEDAQSVRFSVQSVKGKSGGQVFEADNRSKNQDGPEKNSRRRDLIAHSHVLNARFVTPAARRLLNS